MLNNFIFDIANKNILIHNKKEKSVYFTERHAQNITNEKFY